LVVLNPLLIFFKSYLTERKQCVEIRESSEDHNTYLSDLKTVSYGIPQGSCISPELYDIATLDLNDHLSCANMIQYADYINLSIIGKDIEELNNKTIITLRELQIWCDKIG
jgi:hypothetical protein